MSESRNGLIDFNRRTIMEDGRTLMGATGNTHLTREEDARPLVYFVSDPQTFWGQRNSTILSLSPLPRQTAASATFGGLLAFEAVSNTRTPYVRRAWRGDTLLPIPPDEVTAESQTVKDIEYLAELAKTIRWRCEFEPTEQKENYIRTADESSALAAIWSEVNPDIPGARIFEKADDMILLRDVQNWNVDSCAEAASRVKGPSDFPSTEEEFKLSVATLIGGFMAKCYKLAESYSPPTT